MAWLKFSAEKIFDGERFLPQNTVVILNERGAVEALLPAADAGDEVRYLNGILLPGLINAHCHLELSHFKASIAPGGGLVSFLFSVLEQRRLAWQPEAVQAALQTAAEEMWSSGIVAVGDICNTSDAIAVKKSSSLLWHNLVEVLNFSDQTLPQRWAAAEAVVEAHLLAGLHQTVLTPHAAYSVTPQTFKALNKAAAGKTISIHNQETAAEDELFLKGSGDFLRLYELTKTTALGKTECSSLQAWLPFFNAEQTIISVHNTFIQKEDIHFAKAQEAAHGVKLFYCLCPGANQFIEGLMPPLPMMIGEGCRLLLGTDSYSSNYQLSIASEMALLQQHYPQVPVEGLLKAATAAGADAFGWHQLGRLQKGKTPGLTLLHVTEDGTLAGTSEKVA